MITIYLHSGTGKTGSSAIQAFLNYNRGNLLANCSCLYPDFYSKTIHKGSNCHNHCKSISKQAEKITIINDIEKAVDFCKKNGISTIVISCEGLFARPDIGESILRNFHPDSGLSFRIVVFFRRQDHFLESGWKQWGLKDIRFASISEYVESNNIRWLDYLNEYDSIFGKENIIIHPYEKEQLPDGLICEFLTMIGIRYSAYTWREPPESNVNTNYGFNRDIIEILKLNRSLCKNIHDNTLLNFFYSTLPDTYQKKPYEHYDLLSPQERIKILEKYDTINQTIAREYLGREDGKLFFEPWPDPDEPWEPYEGLTVEKIVPIFTTMLYNIDRRHNTRIAAIRKKKGGTSLRTFAARIKKRLWSFFEDRI